MARTKKQTELPGLEKSTHKELDTLMEEHAALASTLGETRQRMGELAEQMLAKAIELKLTVYRHETAVPPLLLTVTEGTAKLKVKPAVGAVVVDEAEVDEEGGEE
ncbi:MAG TPA: hypothetical protein PLT35_09565 [Vicinamibacterales bacterium]|nr:hypothetical protein [Vicinamibacterales bacterium]